MQASGTKPTTITQFLINTSHYVSGNTYRFNLPQGRTLNLDSNSQIALTSISMFNSTFNVKQSWANNKLIVFSNQFNLNAVSLANYVKVHTRIQ